VTPEQSAALRQPFPASQVGLLPKITCGACSKAQGRVCDKHSKSKCNACDNYITGAHMHLDYVGHGAVSDRLLEVDPGWSWEPLAFDQAGMPCFIYDSKGNPVSFWIRLTVAGVTRLGVGSCPSGQGDAEKVLIGDALRNAAMRFGVALDLWIKGHGEDDEKRTDGRQSGRGSTTARPASEDAVIDLVNRMNAIPDAEARAAVKRAFVAEFGKPDQLKQSQVVAADALVSAAEIAGGGGEVPDSPPDGTETATAQAAPLPGTTDTPSNGKEAAR